MKRKNKIMWAVRDRNDDGVVELFMDKPLWKGDDPCNCGDPGCPFGGSAPVPSTAGWQPEG